MKNENKEYEEYLKEILQNQKTLQNLSKGIIVLLLALIVIKLFVTG